MILNFISEVEYILVEIRVLVYSLRYSVGCTQYLVYNSELKNSIHKKGYNIDFKENV